MDNSIKIFKNDVFGEVRVAGTSEEPLFCLADVCNAVELSNPSALKHLKLRIEGSIEACKEFVS